MGGAEGQTCSAAMWTTSGPSLPNKTLPKATWSSYPVIHSDKLCSAASPQIGTLSCLPADVAGRASAERFQQGGYLGVVRVAVSGPQAKSELGCLGSEHERGLAGGAPALAQQQIVLDKLGSVDRMPSPGEHLGPRAHDHLMAGNGDLDVLARVPAGAVPPPHDTGGDGERPVPGRECDCGGNRRVVAVWISWAVSMVGGFPPALTVTECL